MKEATRMVNTLTISFAHDILDFRKRKYPNILALKNDHFPI